MPTVVLALASVTCFLGLAHAAVSTPRRPFLAMVAVLAVAAGLLCLVAPVAGVAILGPVLLSRRLARPLVPAALPADFARD